MRGGFYSHNMKTRELIYNLLWRTGVARFVRKLLVRDGRFVIIFHGIYSQKYAQFPAEVQPYYGAEEFRSVLSWLASEFGFLSPDEFLYSDKSGVLLTFDDGFANNAQTAVSILQEFDAPAIFFITTQHVIEPSNWLPATRRMARQYWRSESEVPKAAAEDLFDGMSEEMLLDCAKNPLITIAAHTVSHPFLCKITTAEIVEELQSSKEYLEKITGEKVEYFAYPTGDYDQRAIDALRRVGYKAAFAVQSKKLGSPEFEIPRVGLYYAAPAYLSVKLSGLYQLPITDSYFSDDE